MHKIVSINVNKLSVKFNKEINLKLHLSFVERLIFSTSEENKIKKYYYYQ